MFQLNEKSNFPFTGSVEMLAQLSPFFIKQNRLSLLDSIKDQEGQPFFSPTLNLVFLSFLSPSFVL